MAGNHFLFKRRGFFRLEIFPRFLRASPALFSCRYWENIRPTCRSVGLTLFGDASYTLKNKAQEVLLRRCRVAGDHLWSPAPQELIVRFSAQSARAIRRPGFLRTRSFPSRQGNLTDCLAPEGGVKSLHTFLAFRESPAHLEILRPFGIERMGLASDLDMSPDGSGRCIVERFSLPPGEDPIPTFNPSAVFLLDPSEGFVGVAVSEPVPDQGPEGVVDSTEGGLGDDVPVVIGPSPNDGVQNANQLVMGDRLALLQDIPDLVQKGLHVFLCRLDQEFVSIFPNILSEEVKPFPDMMLCVSPK